MKEMKCESCGKAIVEKYRKNHEYKYCSYSCYYDLRYGKLVGNKKVKSRNPSYIEASKLLQEGFTQRKVAEAAGVNFYAFRDWLSGKSKEIYSDAVCRYCGVELAGMRRIGKRKYCSRSCGNKAKYREKHPEAQSRQRHTSALLEAALGLYWKGLGGRAIAVHLGIPEGTVHSWIHEFGGEKERMKPYTPHYLLPFKQRLREAKTAEEWVEALRTKALPNCENESGKSVRLVCETVDGRKDAPGLVTIIVECLKSNPFCGEVFAFCNKSYTAITTVIWENNMFVTTGFHKISGSFVWPHEKLGQAIEVSSHEFEYMISFCKIRQKFVVKP